MPPANGESRRRSTRRSLRQAALRPRSCPRPSRSPKPDLPASPVCWAPCSSPPGLAGLAYAFWPVAAVPQWSFDNKPFFLGEDVPLAWTYEPPRPGIPLRFEVESGEGEGGGFKPATCTDARHYYVGNVNATRSWRLRAVADCAAKTPVSDWSAPIIVTQYDSVYQRIKAKGEADIFVSNSQDQDMFKWGDQGFDIDLTNLILRELSTRMGEEVKLMLNAVDWKKLLPEAGSGNADFSISSITKRAYREEENGITFSNPYFCTTHALMYRAGTPDGAIAAMVAGRIVGAQRDSTNYRLAEALAEHDAFKLEAFDNTESLKNALRASRIDFAVTDTSFAQSVQLDTRLADGVDQIEFKEFGPADMPPFLRDEATQDYAIAVRKGEIELLGVINATIEKAKADGELKVLFDKAAKAYEAAHNFKPGSRNLGPRPWECAGP
jgi:ABC-type amino acid transport substrate-binding protein